METNSTSRPRLATTRYAEDEELDVMCQVFYLVSVASVAGAYATPWLIWLVQQVLS